MSHVRFFVPKDQDWFISYMQEQGYQSCEGGVCFGLAHMGMQAVLAKELNNFDNRLKLMYDLYLKQSVADHVDLKNAIHAFLDGVEIAEQLHLYRHLTPQTDVVHQSSQIVLPLTSSIKLDVEGGVETICEFTGAYDQADLVKYFESLRGVFAEHETPVALMLKNNDHSIMVSFDNGDQNKKQWVLVNASVSERYDSESEIVEAVLDAFDVRDVTMMSTKVYATKLHAKDIGEKIASWQQTKEYKDLHTVTDAKAKMLDADQISWLVLAIMNDDVEKALELIQQNINLDTPRLDNASPLFLAVIKNQEKVVAELLKHSADQAVMRNGVTPREMARRLRYTKVLELFDAAKQSSLTRHLLPF